MSSLPMQLELKTGEEAEFELEGLSAGGYRWRHELDGDDDVVDVVWRPGTVAATAERSAGRSAAEIVTLRGLRPGTVRVRLAQARPWETKAPLKSHEIAVRVTSTGAPAGKTQ